MSRRIVVSPACVRPCPSCFVCDSSLPATSLEEALAAEPASPDQPIVLGGGDATRWPYLYAYLTANARRLAPYPVWIEAPAASFSLPVLQELARRGVRGVRVQIEALGERMITALGVGDGEQVIERAESLGVQTEARVCVRPKTLMIVGPLARRLNPRPVWIEILRQDWGSQATTLDPAPLDKVLVSANNARFSAHRARDTGYLPPCTMPATWRTNNALWRSTFSESPEPNRAIPICDQCVLSRRCQWNDPGALSEATLAAARPIRTEPAVRKAVDLPVPEIIIKRRPKPDVICTEPWTTLEIPAHEGLAYQCGTDWTTRPLGNIHQQTLMEIWNGEGFQAARRLMGQATLEDLCKPICTRLYDGALNEDRYRIQSGSEAFVQNQLLIAEEIAERKEVLRGMPRHLTLCPSSYCNYDCIFCHYGRLPRVDVPDRIWDELPLFLPTLKTLTLLGGEPFASPRVWDLLRGIDTDKYPDVRLDIFTNGALMTEKALARVKSSALGEITISLNAGKSDVYEAIERGTASLDQVMENVDALIRFRDESQWWFGITLSMIVMRENAHTLIPFGELVRERNLHMRLVGLNVKNFEELNFYTDPEEVRRVVEHVDTFIAWAQRAGRADYARQGQNAREAILGEAAKATIGRPDPRLIPLRVHPNGFRAAF